MIKIKAPATIANIVCGFDILGLAINDPYDEMEIKITNEIGIKITHTDSFALSNDPTKNVAGVALQALLNDYPNKTIGFHITINKKIKPGSGLGSSAASAAGAVVGANYLLKNYYSKKDLVRFAMFGEELASGVKHADNITPCIFGGVTLVRSNSPLDIIQIAAPLLYVAVVHPQIEIKTADARNILPKEILLKDAIQHWGNVAGLVAGFLQNDYDLISRSLNDNIIEPVRSKLIPLFDTIKNSSIELGALGGGISGSGPSIFMLCKTPEIATNVAELMLKKYNEINLLAYTYITTINNNGVTITTD